MLPLELIGARLRRHEPRVEVPRLRTLLLELVLVPAAEILGVLGLFEVVIEVLLPTMQLSRAHLVLPRRCKLLPQLVDLTALLLDLGLAVIEAGLKTGLRVLFVGERRLELTFELRMLDFQVLALVDLGLQGGDLGYHCLHRRARVECILS